jgi:hypothetical protein
MSLNEQIETVKKLKELVDAGILTAEEFEAKNLDIDITDIDTYGAIYNETAEPMYGEHWGPIYNSLYPQTGVNCDALPERVRSAYLGALRLRRIDRSGCCLHREWAQPRKSRNLS